VTNATILRFLSSRPVMAQWILWAVITFVSCSVNVLSILHEWHRSGEAIEAWKPWCWEMSSAIAWCVTFALLFPWDDRVARRGFGLPARIGLYGLASIACSVVHVGLMVGLRVLVYALAGLTYRFGATLPEFLYEYRKDVVTLTLVIPLAMVWRQGLRMRAAAPAAAAQGLEPAFLVPGRDGDTLVRAGEIDWIEAQGNYVALHVGGQEKLLRQPLKEIEAKLTYMAFIRTHRSALVNLRRVKRITRTELGEVRVEFESCESAPLSASRRAEVVKALAAH